MTEALLALLAIGMAAAISWSLIVWQRHRDAETRGMIGLAATALHMFASLSLAAVMWWTAQPSRPLVFAISVLIFYWLSLIVLVVAIIRWIKTAREG